MAVEALGSTSDVTQLAQTPQLQPRAQNTDAAAAAPATTGNGYIDKKDLNQDGFVSALEEYLYDLARPAQAGNLNMPAQYNAQGGMVNITGRISRFIDITA